MEYEIHKRQLKYLQRILQLEQGDPVREAFNFQLHQRQNGVMENNWWSGVSELIARYDIDSTLEEIQTMTKEQFKKLVNSKVESVALLELTSECKAKKKTQDLEYADLKMQEYLHKLYPTSLKWCSNVGATLWT